MGKLKTNLKTDRKIAPEGEPRRRKTVANVCAFISVVFAAYFFLLGPLVNVDFPLIGGPKRLLIEDNKVRLSILRSFDSLQLFFDEKVFIDGYEVYIVKNGGSKRLLPGQDYDLSGDATQGLKMILKNRDSAVDETMLILNLRGSNSASFPTKKFINALVLNQEEVSVTSFYQHFLDHKHSNVQYYKSFTIQNISGYLARTMGLPLLYIVTGGLIILLVSQIIIFFLSVGQELYFKDLPQLGVNARIPINWLDYMSEGYSTFFGFLGTVLSLWVALERASTDFSNFFDLLAVIKYAVFTTVLGLLIRTIYGIREFHYKIVTDSKEKGNDE